MDTSRANLLSSIGLLILRLGVGLFMISHGWGKVQMIQAGTFEQMGDPIGLGPKLSLFLVTGAEVVCAGLVMIGLATRLAAVPVVFAMGVAAFLVHANDPLFMSDAVKAFFTGASKTFSSKEPALLFLIPFLTLIFTGPGRFSVDHLIASRWRARSGAAGLVGAERRSVGN